MSCPSCGGVVYQYITTKCRELNCGHSRVDTVGGRPKPSRTNMQEVARRRRCPRCQKYNVLSREMTELMPGTAIELSVRKCSSCGHKKYSQPASIIE